MRKELSKLTHITSAKALRVRFVALSSASFLKTGSFEL